MGGGIENSISLLQFFKILESITGTQIGLYFDEWRPGDQHIFISDNSKAEKLLNFKPKISCQLGIELIYKWLLDYYSSRNMVFVKQSKQVQISE
jgi:CDP-paratose 2-epimerase